MAEWLGKALQKLLQQFDPARNLLQPSPFTERDFFYFMFTKVLKVAGIIACVTLVVSCFMPWAYYDDLHQTFTGFYSYNNQYGKPGKFLSLIAVVVLAFIFLPKIWAKRSNIFIAALGVGYSVKTFILFTSCYNAYCPEKKLGIYVMLLSSLVILLSAIFPDMKMEPDPSAIAKADGDVNG